MSDDKDLYVCIGSACHQMGVFNVLPRLEELLRASGLQDSVHLKGHFCLGPCADGILVRFGDRLIKHINVANVDQVFEEEILPCLK